MRSLLTNYTIHGTTLALASFFVVNVFGSAALAVIAQRLTRRPAGMSANALLALRMLPAAASGLFVAAVFLPSYWTYEPIESNEGFDVTLTICAVAALVMLVASSVRGLTAWMGTVRRARAWMRTARPLQLEGASLPAYEIAADTPVMALVGIVRPRLLVTRGLVEALTPEELAASVAHEMSHSSRRDNLKRLLMRSAPDAFCVSAASSALERLWAAAAEHGADHLASGGDPTRRCALASALVKVARLRPVPTPQAEPICTLMGGSDIASRVRRLLDESCAAPPATTVRTYTWMATATALVATVVLYTPMLRGVHEITEILVSSLP